MKKCPKCDAILNDKYKIVDKKKRRKSGYFLRHILARQKKDANKSKEEGE